MPRPSSAPPASFRHGARTSLPITLGYFPVGISFGIAASRAGLSVFEATFVSMAIYAGASQFLALTLLTGGAPVIVSALSVLAMNLRHVLYGPAIMEKAGPGAPIRYSWAWAGWLSDGGFGAAYVGLQRPGARFSERWMFGIGMGPYLAWCSGTAVGALVGTGPIEAWPAVDAALGFLMPALFLAMLLSVLSRVHLPAIAAGLLVSLAGTLTVSATFGIVMGMVAGALVGVAGWGQGRDTDRFDLDGGVH
ncbi:AzlC family ABC transporter permease [Pelagibacterium montanilacus]|uniref:AzlC family ABC transporter permease n=1 Tax=Pelagibacterium montanilacus TaxID=2185280 RepID=UPI000F8CDEE2|nr:AzlC family ABC transporter permease [Pelagibacterium montanilacus]